MNDCYDFGLILQKLRQERGLTQEQLAKMIHKESSIISRYENNLQNPTFDTVRAFAAIFHVSMDYLSGMESDTSVSTVGLTDDQCRLLLGLAESLRRKNTGMDKEPSGDDYCLIGRITAELVRSL